MNSIKNLHKPWRLKVVIFLFVCLRALEEASVVCGKKLDPSLDLENDVEDERQTIEQVIDQNLNHANGDGDSVEENEQKTSQKTKKRRRRRRRRNSRTSRRLNNQRMDCESDCLLGIHRLNINSSLNENYDNNNRDTDDTSNPTTTTMPVTQTIMTNTMMKEQEIMNCVLHCMSPKCYMSTYITDGRGGGPLEPGEIDVYRFVEFEICMDDQEKEAKAASRRQRSEGK